MQRLSLATGAALLMLGCGTSYGDPGGASEPMVVTNATFNSGELPDDGGPALPLATSMTSTGIAGGAEKSLAGRAKALVQGFVGDKESSEAYLERVLETYFEFPPVVRAQETRWSKPWDEETYPTPPALLDRPVTDAERAFETHATSYTWICYARVRTAARP